MSDPDRGPGQIRPCQHHGNPPCLLSGAEGTALAWLSHSVYPFLPTWQIPFSFCICGCGSSESQEASLRPPASEKQLRVHPCKWAHLSSGLLWQSPLLLVGLIHSTQRSPWKKWSRLAFSNYGTGRGTEVAIWTWVGSRAEPRRLKWVREVRAGCGGKEADLGAGGSGPIQHLWIEAHLDCFPQDLGSPKTSQRSFEFKWKLPHFLFPCYAQH